MNMIQKLKKNKKGFTLVELLVVLVILAILAAAIIPSMMGFIDKAKEESVAAECRSAVLAAQVVINEDYGLNLTSGTDYKPAVDKINTIAAFVSPMAVTACTVTAADAKGHVAVATMSYNASNGFVYAYAGTADGTGTWTKGAKVNP